MLILGGVEKWLGDLAYIEERAYAVGSHRAFVAWARGKAKRRPNMPHATTKPTGWSLAQINRNGTLSSAPSDVAPHLHAKWMGIWGGAECEG